MAGCARICRSGIIVEPHRNAVSRAEYRCGRPHLTGLLWIDGNVATNVATFLNNSHSPPGQSGCKVRRNGCVLSGRSKDRPARTNHWYSGKPSREADTHGNSRNCWNKATWVALFPTIPSSSGIPLRSGSYSASNPHVVRVAHGISGS